MAEVERFAHRPNLQFSLRPDTYRGQWVRYSDYEKLRAEREKLRQEQRTALIVDRAGPSEERR